MKEKGICLLPCIPVRSASKSQAELVTQLLFGESYNVLEKAAEWFKIKIDYDGYEGYISSNQHSVYSVDKVPSNIITALISQHSKIWFPMGSQFAGNTDTKIKNLNLTSLAQSWLGVPYLWGGKTALGVDCSGFVQVLFKVIGIPLLRDASQQAKQGETVSLENSKEGDLAFFKNDKGKITHVGLLLSPESIIHAAGKVRLDSLDKKGIWNEELKSYTHTLSHIQRIE